MSDTSVRDLVIIGAGPSALAAAVYTTREDIDTVLYEKAVVGGLAAVTDKVDNYPGFPDGIPGLQLAEQLEKQAVRFGAHIEYGEVTTLRGETNPKVVVVDGKEVYARAILIATGSEYRKLGIPGEAEYYGRGVHYCATCDGAFYRDKNIAVVGGGNSAVQEALFLTKFAKHIDLLVRTEVKASEVLIHELEKAVASGKITVHLNTTTNEICAADNTVHEVKIQTDGQRVNLAVDGVFVFIGLRPNTQFLRGTPIACDDRGLIITDHELRTTMPGVFACGDVRSGATMQIASAVGEGATAALNIRGYLESLDKELSSQPT